MELFVFLDYKYKELELLGDEFDDSTRICDSEKVEFLEYEEAGTSTYAEAMVYIEGEKSWSCVDKKRHVDGRSFYFRCNKTKRRAQQSCPSKLSLSFNYGEDHYYLHIFEWKGAHP